MKVRLWKAAGLLLVTSGAWAQTSVTLYGRVDGGIEYLNHISERHGRQCEPRGAPKAATGAPACWASRATKISAAGLNAVFDLETGLQIMNGTTGGGRLWSRRAYVGLKARRGASCRPAAISLSTATACGNSIRSCSRRCRRRRSCADATGSRRATTSSTTARCFMASTCRGSMRSAIRRARSTAARRASSAARTASC